MLEKTLESPLDRKEIKPVNPKINQSWILTGGLMLKLKLQCFGHLMQRADSLEKTLMLGKIEGRRRRGWQRTGWLHGITDSKDTSLSKLQETVKGRETWCIAVHGVTKSQTQLSGWATTQWGCGGYNTLRQQTYFRWNRRVKGTFQQETVPSRRPQ